MPMIATTIISSIRVKPFCSVLIRYLPLSWCYARLSLSKSNVHAMSQTRQTQKKGKKKGTPKGTFYEAKSLLLAAAGAGQIFRADRGAVAGRSAAPAKQGLAACRYRGRHCGAR